MSLLQILGLKRHFGAHEVLRGVDLSVEEGAKIGLVGRNGEGKTTLLRLVEGEDTPDAGEVRIARGVRLGYVRQRPSFAAGETVRAFVAEGLEEVHATRAELESVGAALGGAEGEELARAMRRYDELQHRMEFLDGWNAESRVEAVMHGIGLDEEFWEREAATLSGGEKSRAMLARELVSTPDLLLLDEPTNHLDLVGIEWLEEYLKSLKGAVLIVSHDRRLLDRAVTAIAELERGLLTRYPGNYSRYLDIKRERFETAHRAWSLQQDMIRKEEGFIRKHIGSQRTAEAKGRQRKLANVVRLVQPYNDVRRPVIRLASTERGGEEVLAAEGLAAGYDGVPIFRSVDVRIGRGERIGIVGPNGSGKSTLLKVLAGRMAPLAGELRYGHKAACGFYDQEVAGLREEGTPWSEIRRQRPEVTDQEVRDHLARFLFRGEDVNAEVRSLSGGERARLALAKLVLTQPSWLALDEPTNHLDLGARTALEEMLGTFEGALVCVSHDREFLDGLCNGILALENGRVRRFAGNYSAWRAAVQVERESGLAQRRTERAEAKAAPKPAAKPKPKVQAQAQSKAQSHPQATAEQPAKARGGKPRNPWRFRELEAAIIALEEERARLRDELGLEAVWRDPSALRDRQVRLAEVERDLEQKNHEWERWT